MRAEGGQGDVEGAEAGAERQPGEDEHGQGRRAHRAEPVALGVGILAGLDREQAVEDEHAGDAEGGGEQQAERRARGRRDDPHQ